MLTEVEEAAFPGFMLLYDSTHPPNGTPKEIVDCYNRWAPDYDKLSAVLYNGPMILADVTAGLVPEGSRATAKVLDVAAGTGLVGRQLHQRGFRLLDALEPSSGMLKELEDSGIYTNKFNEFVGFGHHSDVPADTYDIVVVCGGFDAGHIPLTGIDDMIRAAKSGGLVVLAMRKNVLETVDKYREQLEPHMARLETKGLWTLKAKNVVKKYAAQKEGIIYIYSVL